MKFLELDDFDLPANPSDEARRRWRAAVSLVRNPRRRFRFIVDLAKQDELKLRTNQIQANVKAARARVALMVLKAAFQFVDAEARAAGFEINPDALAAVVRAHNLDGLKSYDGVDGIAKKLRTSLTEGVCTKNIQTSSNQQNGSECLNSAPTIDVRQKIFGFNRFTEKPPKPFWMFVWEAMHDLTLIILIVCAIVSIGVGLATEGWPDGMYEGLGIVVSILLVVLVTASSDYKQSLQFRDLDKEKKKISIQVTRDGKREKISIYDLVVGDIIHLSVGDQVPVDGILVLGHSLMIDESSLTGESDLKSITEDNPFLLSGTKVKDGSGVMLATTVGMRTEWGKLMEALSEGGEDETPLQVKLNGVATVIGKIGLVFAVLTFLVLTVRFLVEKAINNSFTDWSSSDALKLLDYFATAVTIIVVAVPEGLPLAVTLSLAFAMKKLMNDKALVRHLSACETMGSASCICTDKTGTLTTNHMVVVKVWLCGVTKEIAHKGREDALRPEVSEEVQSLLLQAVFQNTGAEVVEDKKGKNSILGSPTESALLEFGLLLGGDFRAQRNECKILKIMPFSSERKKMSVVVALPDGQIRAFCKGASEIVLGMCNKFVDKNGEIVDLPDEQVKKITDVINSFACEALRTLCLAFKDIDDSSFDPATDESIPNDGYTLITVVGIKDPVRPGVREAVKTCLDAGITVRMVTGDNINTAKAIARECGILSDDGLAVEGPQFRITSPQDMMRLVPNLQVIARSSPMDKHQLVKHLRNAGEVVAVTGDGTNDAPALHESDIGLAMGIAGTEVAKENADVIIMDDNFTTILNVAKWGRAVYINIQKFVQFQLTVNIVALVINFFSACISGSAPLTAVQLLWVNMIMDTLGALALATEPPTDELMKRPPVKRAASFITKIMWKNIIGQSIYQLVVLFVLNFAGKQILGLSGPDSTDVLNTLIFNSFVFCQVFNEINSRDMEKINVFKGMFDSWIFISVMVSTVVFQAIIIEFLGTFASTVPLSWQLWLLSIGIGSVGLLVSVVLKCIPLGKDTSKKHHEGYDPLPSGPEQA